MRWLSVLVLAVGHLSVGIWAGIRMGQPGDPVPNRALPGGPAGAAPLDEVIRRLDAVPLEGASFGGPHVAVHPNDLTRTIVAGGDWAVDPLVAHLGRATYPGAVYVVDCLHKLRAKAARSAVAEVRRALLAGERFEDAPHDLT